LWKFRAKLPEKPEFHAKLPGILKKASSGPPYPQKPRASPLTLSVIEGHFFRRAGSGDGVPGQLRT
jgi:hypothetical protein